MKILMLCEFYDEKLEYQENLITKYYTKHGHQVVVITSTFETVFEYYAGKHSKRRYERIYYDNQAKIIKLEFKYNLLNKIRPFTSIKKILEDEKPDLIYIHDIILNILEVVNYVKINPNSKMILDYHADYSNSGKNWFSLKILHGLIRKYYLDNARPYLSKIFPVVPAGVKFLHEVYKVPYAEMEVLPLGADVDLGLKAKESKNLDLLKRKYNITSETRVIITGGKLSPRKKTEELIGAFKNLPYDDKCLIIIGDSAEEDKEYKQLLLDAAQNSGQIHFVGWLDKVSVYEHFAISSLAVFPASQSILWQQAISMGLPLIAGNTGEQSIQYLNLYENIVILENADINMLKIESEIKKILSDRELYEKMRQGALKVSREQLDWNFLIERTLRFNKQ